VGAGDVFRGLKAGRGAALALPATPATRACLIVAR